MSGKHYHRGHGRRRRSPIFLYGIRSVSSLVFRVLCGVAFCAVAVGHAQVRGVAARVTPLVEHDRVAAGSTVRAALEVALPEGFHVQSNQPRDPSLIPTKISFTAPSGVTVTEVVFPPAVELKQLGVDQPLAVFEREFAIGVVFSVAKGTARGDLVVPGQLRYQACNDAVCFPPKTVPVEWTFRVGPGAGGSPAQHAAVFERIAFGSGAPPDVTAPAPVVLTDLTGPVRSASAVAEASLDDFEVLSGPDFGGYMPPDEFLKHIRDAESGVRQAGLLENRGPLAILLIVFLGGLALNLTPCVLPMIPINLAIIGAGAKAGSRRRGFVLGSAYGAAMALVYGVLGLVVILTAGTFGTINSSPWFNLAIALLFIVLGLAMFDIITIDLSRFSSGPRVSAAGRGSVMVAFGMGAVAALLAGACVAPVVIQVVLFSSDLYAKGTSAALALPFFLGIGMALPWPIAGAGIAALPKPGAWMVRVKQLLGVLILATAAYYGYETYSLFANRWVDPAAVTSSVQEKLKAGWYSSLNAGLETARRDQKPVLVDMWATWCKNCLTMDVTTMKDPAVMMALDRYVKIKFQAEDPDREPAKSVMRRFDAVGLPTYVILRSKTR